MIHRRLNIIERTISAVLLVAGMSGCSNSTGSDGPMEVRPVTWVDSAWTQPVPAWGSPVRLNLPVPLGSIVLAPGGGFGAYGAHEGGHVEGLNHIWIPIIAGTPITSWADGTVTRIDDTGDRGDGKHEYFITIDYGQGLVGKHLDVEVMLVKLGDKVRQGDRVATGPSAEFMLYDQNRSDGERSDVGSMVSPFDYLRDDVKAAVIARHISNVVDPYFKAGKAMGNSRPWEPYLTNKMLYHKDHPGSVAGEWILSNKGWNVPDPLYYDVMAIFDVTNQYGQFHKFEVMDYDWSKPGNKKNGTGSWTPGDGPGKIIFALTGNVQLDGTYYGLYKIDEAGGRAKMSIEWKKGSYPDVISSNAAVYTERSATYLSDDAQKLGILK
ncbi:MAG: hypothetical protein NTU47_10815 [Ignavibacteriales bacterium]|nr:hypothetical protein [Ignavibacteriales bacterium]